MVIYPTSDFSVFIKLNEYSHWHHTTMPLMRGLEMELLGKGYVPSKFQKAVTTENTNSIVRDFLHLPLMKTVNLYSANTIISL